jgi:hypothetical protein
MAIFLLVQTVDAASLLPSKPQGWAEELDIEDPLARELFFLLPFLFTTGAGGKREMVVFSSAIIVEADRPEPYEK